MNAINNLILSRVPDYDFNRYRYKAGDCVDLEDGARIIVEYSVLEYVQAFVIKRSFKYPKGEHRVPYSELPYYTKCDVPQLQSPVIHKSLKWKLWTVVPADEIDGSVLLVESAGCQAFYGFVLSCSENYKYYLNTRIYISNPFQAYFTCGGSSR